MVVRLIGATSFRDNKCSDLLAQWMSSSPLIRAYFSEAMDHTPLPAVHKTKVQASRTYAEALFPAPYLIGLLLELGAPRSCCLSTSPAGAMPTLLALACPSHGPSPYRTNLTQRGSHSSLRLRCPPPPPRWNVPTPRRRVAVGPYSRRHNTCNPGQPCASPLTGPAPLPLWCGVTGTHAPVPVGCSYPLGY